MAVMDAATQQQAGHRLDPDRRSRFGKRFFAWAVPLVALLAVALMLVPAEVWRPPVNDAIYQGFDPNLVVISQTSPASAVIHTERRPPSGSQGLVEVSADALQITALPDSQPRAHLATTPFRSFRVATDVRILESRQDTVPLRIGIWSPRAKQGYFVAFGPAPDNLITAETLVQSPTEIITSPEEFAVSNEVATKSETLGAYTPGDIYRLELAVDKKAGVITSRLIRPGAPAAPVEAMLTAQEAPELFDSLRLSLTVSAAAETGRSSAVLENYSLTLPDQRWLVAKIDDPLATGLVTAVLALGGLLVAVRIGLWVQGRMQQGTAFGSHTGILDVLRRPGGHPDRGFILRAGVAVVAFLVLNGLLFRLGSQPFDMTSEKVWTYVVATAGPLGLYYLPSVVSMANVDAGIPFYEAVFPYNFVMAYHFTLIGWIYKLVFSLQEPGVLLTQPSALELLIKAFNVLFALGDGVLIYLIVRKLTADRRRSAVAASLFLFNPAVWFSAAIWGQTHVVSIFPMLAAIWFAEKRHPFGAWLALGAAALTRPQMLVPALFLGLFLLRKFPARENVYAVCWTVIVAFLLLGPFALAISPSLPVDILAGTLLIQEGGGNEPAVTVLSWYAYSIWPLVAHVADGARQMDRFYLPSGELLVGTLSYQQVSRLLTLAIVLPTAAAVLFCRRSAARPGDYLVFLALGMVGFLMFKTGLAVIHFLLALPLLIMLWGVMAGYVSTWSVIIWSVTTLVPMYGSLGFDTANLSPPELPIHYSNSLITLFAMYFFSADWFTTLGILANTGVLLWLFVLAARLFRRSLRQREAPAALGAMLKREPGKFD